MSAHVLGALMNTLRNIFTFALARNGMTASVILAAGASMASTPSADVAQTVSAGALSGITMTGRCPNGEAFRLFSYDKEVEGYWKSFYDYQGPVGTGTVKTRTAPKVMASRVCVALAEIASDE